MKRLKSYSNLNSPTLHPKSQSNYSSNIKDSTLDIPKNALVIYGEDKRYFCLFKPIIDALEKLKYPYSFYTSDEADPMLEHKSDIAEIKFIGKGTKAATILNTLQADICLLTTPQLDVLEIKRSKGVKHYCHILHSMGHIELYEIFALDYFDSVFTNSPIHTDFIREVEKIRGLKAKQIEIIGCPYLDYLHNKLDTLPQINPSHKTTTILLAPSWGRESILEKYGLKLLKPLLDTGYNVIIRPHPQSYISQKSILDNLTQTLKSYSNLKWDNNADNIYAMAESDLMIGDFSGVLFDYICLFNKPLLTMEFAFNSIGYDLEDTSYKDNTWKDKALKDISQTIREQDFINIKSIIDSALNDTSKFQNRLKYKELLWHHAHQGGMQTALKLLSIHKSILEEGLGEFIEVHNVINAIESKINTTANSACSDFLGSASASSLQRTASASHSSASHNPKNSSTILEFAEGNSPLGETFRPFENFEHSQTHSLASRPKFSKDTKAPTASRGLDEQSEVPNTRIFLNANDGELQSDSMESNAESSDSAESFGDSTNSIELNSKIDCHDSTTQNLTMTTKGDSIESTKIISHAETCGLSRNDSPTSSLRGDLSPKQSIRNDDFINNADSTDSMESSEKMDCHDKPNGNSRNDSSTSSLRGQRPKQSICDSIESNAESSDFVDSNNSKNIMDCHENPCGFSRNDEQVDDSIPSYRLCEHSQNVKQSAPLYRHCEALQKPKRALHKQLIYTCKSIDANNLAESRRNEKAENADSTESNAESLKDSSHSIESAKDSSTSTQGLKDSITSSHSVESFHDSTQSIKDSTPHTKDSINE